MRYRYIFLTLSLIVMGSICTIQAKKQQEQNPQENSNRVAIIPGNQGARPQREEGQNFSSDSKKTKEKKISANSKNVIENRFSTNKRVNTSTKENRVALKEDRIAIVPGNQGSQPQTEEGQSVFPSSKKSKQTHFFNQSKNKHLNAEYQIKKAKGIPSKIAPKVAIIPDNTSKPIPKVSISFPQSPKVAIVPCTSSQIFSTPIASPSPAPFPAQVLRTDPQLPSRPVILSRPIPQAVVIDNRSAAYGYATLAPYAISPKGDFVQLEDGSQWRVRHRHYKTIKRWSSNDAILIETGKFFTWSAYKLVNHTRGEFVDVELIEPIQQGSLSHWITEINPYEGFIRLQDGSYWRMSANELLNWNVNDDVIIALTKNWFSNQNSYVLINPKVKNRLIAIYSY